MKISLGAPRTLWLVVRADSRTTYVASAVNGRTQNLSDSVNVGDIFITNRTRKSSPKELIILLEDC